MRSAADFGTNIVARVNNILVFVGNFIVTHNVQRFLKPMEGDDNSYWIY